MVETNHLTPAKISIEILNQIGLEANVSLRLTLANKRKNYRPRDIKFWGQIHAWVMEVLKHQISMDYIQKLLIPNEFESHFKSYIDLATYWQYWGRRRSFKIKNDIKQLLNNQNLSYLNWFDDFLSNIAKIPLKSFSKKIDSKSKQWSFKYSLPELIYDKLLTIHSYEELDALGEYLSKIPIKYFWINPLVEKNPNGLVKNLSKKVKFKPNVFVMNSYQIIKGGQPIQFSGAFHQGKIIIQDVAATAIPSFLPIKENDCVLDVCAAPGNKTVQILTKNKRFDLFAGDLPGNRFDLLKMRLNRLLPENIKKNIHLIPWDARNLPFETKSVDAILIDAPCTGSGTINTQPDNSNYFSSHFISIHTKLQEQILKEAGRVLKDGGYILYVTCSLFPQENEEIIKNFLKDHSSNSWKLIPLNHPLALNSPILEESIRFFPPKSKSEGFFACLIRKIIE